MACFLNYVYKSVYKHIENSLENTRQKISRTRQILKLFVVETTRSVRGVRNSRAFRIDFLLVRTCRCFRQFGWGFLTSTRHLFFYTIHR